MWSNKSSFYSSMVPSISLQNDHNIFKNKLCCSYGGILIILKQRQIRYCEKLRGFTIKNCNALPFLHVYSGLAMNELFYFWSEFTKNSNVYVVVDSGRNEHWELRMDVRALHTVRRFRDFGKNQSDYLCIKFILSTMMLYKYV